MRGGRAEARPYVASWLLPAAEVQQILLADFHAAVAFRLGIAASGDGHLGPPVARIDADDPPVRGRLAESTRGIVRVDFPFECVAIVLVRHVFLLSLEQAAAGAVLHLDVLRLSRDDRAGREVIEREERRATPLLERRRWELPGDRLPGRAEKQHEPAASRRRADEDTGELQDVVAGVLKKQGRRRPDMVDRHDEILILVIDLLRKIASHGNLLSSPNNRGAGYLLKGDWPSQIRYRFKKCKKQHSPLKRDQSRSRLPRARRRRRQPKLLQRGEAIDNAPLLDHSAVLEPHHVNLAPRCGTTGRKCTSKWACLRAMGD